MLESSSWCLFCLESLNNSALSYCSCLNRPFPLIPPANPRPSGLKATTHPSTGGCMCSDSARLSVVLHLVFCLTCCAILWELLVSGLRPFIFSFCLSFFGWAGLVFIVVPSWSHRRCSESWTQRGAAVWCAIRGPEPQSRGEAEHNSLGLNLLFFITPTPLYSPQCYYYSFIYLFICLLVFPQTSRRGFFLFSFHSRFLCCCDSLNEEPLLSRHLAVSGLLWFPCFSVITAENVLFNCIEQGSCAWCLGLLCIVYT